MISPERFFTTKYTKESAKKEEEELIPVIFMAKYPAGLIIKYPVKFYTEALQAHWDLLWKFTTVLNIRLSDGLSGGKLKRQTTWLK